MLYHKVYIYRYTTSGWGRLSLTTSQSSSFQLHMFKGISRSSKVFYMSVLRSVRTVSTCHVHQSNDQLQSWNPPVTELLRANQGFARKVTCFDIAVGQTAMAAPVRGSIQQAVDLHPRAKSKRQLCLAVTDCCSCSPKRLVRQSSCSCPREQMCMRSVGKRWMVER